MVKARYATGIHLPSRTLFSSLLCDWSQNWRPSNCTKFGGQSRHDQQIDFSILQFAHAKRSCSPQAVVSLGSIIDLMHVNDC